MRQQALHWRQEAPDATFFAKWVDGEGGRPVLPRVSTLLELVQTVQDYASTDDEVVAVITDLLRTKRIVLCGIFADRKLNFA